MKIASVISGIGILIFFYLLFAHAKETRTIVNALGGQSVDLIRTLQGRTA